MLIQQGIEQCGSRAKDTQHKEGSRLLRRRIVKAISLEITAHELTSTFVDRGFWKGGRLNAKSARMSFSAGSLNALIARPRGTFLHELAGADMIAVIAQMKEAPRHISALRRGPGSIALER